jgi:hypothetical protein
VGGAREKLAAAGLNSVAEGRSFGFETGGGAT